MDNFNLQSSISLLERTPSILHSWLYDLDEAWTHINEGEGTWSAFDVVGHLIHGEKTDWIPRIKVIMADSSDKTFAPFDRMAQFESSINKSMNELLLEFEKHRIESIDTLIALGLSPSDFNKKGIHPAFGEVTLSALIACWTVHDMDHICQISRVMGKHYKSDVGPWIEYLKVLHQ